jgi:phosphohistidine phosphatase SixA
VAHAGNDNARMRRTSLLLLLSLVTSASAFAQPPAKPAPLAPVKTQATLIIVRHGEKAGDTGDVPLAPAGHTRAAALAHVLRDANISTIFVTDLQRTQQTAAPIAKALKLTPVQVPATDVAGLAAKLAALPAGTTALVVNHNPFVLDLARAFGAKNVGKMEESEFDRMMVLTPGADGNSVLLTLRYGAPTSTP